MGKHRIRHVRTSPYYPQSNGKIERYHRTLKSDCIRTKCPLSLEEAKRVVKQFVSDYNDRRLHSAIGYITPSDMLAGIVVDSKGEAATGFYEKIGFISLPKLPDRMFLSMQTAEKL